MSLGLLLRPEARADLQDGYDWYEEQRPGLGEEFLREVRSVLDRVRDHPTLYQRIHHEVRRALPRRFPYGIFYLVEPNRIVVLAITHQSRDPEIWRQRMP